MCGIVGLHLRDPALYPQLGRLLTGMLARSPSAGPTRRASPSTATHLVAARPGCVSVLDVLRRAERVAAVRTPSATRST